jgi:hypothetical protein
MTFDTLSYARRLKASGFTDQQAETLADATREIVLQDFSANFATKADLLALEERLNARLVALDAKIDAMGLRIMVRMGIMLVAVATIMTAIIGLLIRSH